MPVDGALGDTVNGDYLKLSPKEQAMLAGLKAEKDAGSILEEAREEAKAALSSAEAKAREDGEKALKEAAKDARSQAEDLKKRSLEKKEAATQAVIAALIG